MAIDDGLKSCLKIPKSIKAAINISWYIRTSLDEVQCKLQEHSNGITYVVILIHLRRPYNSLTSELSIKKKPPHSLLMAPVMRLLYFALLSSPILSTVGKAVSYYGCSTSKINMTTLPPPLTAIGKKLNFVGVGVGVQNYTCDNSTNTYKSVLSIIKKLGSFSLY